MKPRLEAKKGERGACATGSHEKPPAVENHNRRFMFFFEDYGGLRRITEGSSTKKYKQKLTHSLSVTSHCLYVTSVPQRLLTISHSFSSTSTLPRLEQLLELKGHYSCMFMLRTFKKGK